MKATRVLHSKDSATVAWAVALHVWNQCSEALSTDCNVNPVIGDRCLCPGVNLKVNAELFYFGMVT